MAKLTAKTIQTAKPGRHADGSGLYLLVKPTGARSWVLRVQVNGQRRDIGMGAVELSPLALRSDIGDDIPLEEKARLTLAEARELSARLRNAAKAGRDPAAERKKDRKPPPSFKDATIATHKAQKKSHSWSDKTADAFLSSLETHAYPTLGKMRVDLVEAEHVANALAPIWTTKPDMAKKVRQRIATVLDYSKAMNWRTTEAPRKAVGALTGKTKKGGNFPAMPYADVPAYFRSLMDDTPTKGRLGLMLAIATVARSIEVREGCWGHVAAEKRNWNRPAELMRKNNEAHTVTLNDAALWVLERIAEVSDSSKPDALLLPNGKGKPISDMTISKVMRDAGLTYVPHGFRSSFRDWAAEQHPEIPDPVAEAALSHSVPDAVIAAYKRTKFLEMRRTLLDHWSAFILSDRTNVVQLADRRA
ncbi:site-specific integrase [Sphingopyxis soli]|uniref:Site-specific integrase n=1 Tax=Sphingopyxis soli TaxID=592051 RepID=A0ABN1LZX1_9SPHN|nr:integrase arm-type DNA-binding domain-containing protein [Sphingopyxis soli]